MPWNFTWHLIHVGIIYFSPVLLEALKFRSFGGDEFFRLFSERKLSKLLVAEFLKRFALQMY